MPAVWFIEQQVSCGGWHYEVRGTADGMKAQYRKTLNATDRVTVISYTGETSIHDANRAYTDDVLKEVH